MIAKGRLLVVCPPRFSRWADMWRPALERAGWVVSTAPYIAGKTDYGNAFACEPTAVLFMNVFGHLDDEEVLLVKHARYRGGPSHFLESWGLGAGVGLSHKLAYQKAVLRYVGDAYHGSPVDSSFGGHLDYVNLPVWDLLGPASVERSSFVTELQKFEDDILSLEQAIDDSAVKIREKEKEGDLPKTINEWAFEAHTNARSKGFWDAYFSGPLMTKRPSALELLGFLMLISGEVAEASEEVRKSDFDPKEIYFVGSAGTTKEKDLTSDGKHIDYKSWTEMVEKDLPLPKPEGFPIEMADVILRAVDLCQALGVDLQHAMELKHAYNKTRTRLHGGKRA